MTSRRKTNWTRTRTGCFTCRARRIKCDERKPICKRCVIGDRECVYSDDVQTSSGRKVIEGQGKSRLLPSTPDQCDVSLMQQESKTLVKHNLLHSINDPKLPMSEPIVTVVDPDLIVHGEIGAIDVLETRFCSQPISAILQQNEPLIDISLIVRCPTWDTDDHIGHFLAFHRASIVAGHYFWYFDLHQFCTTLLLGMAEQSISLRYAVAAFACLVYSVHADRNAKEFAFIYYAKAVQSLQSELNSASRNQKDQHFAILATALQLATVERFIADSPKCFRHLQGAARILQYLSDPLQQSSTTLGRCLLEWYFNLEDHCSLVLARKGLLPNNWREEMLRVRRELTGIEYRLCREDERIPRLLDDTWQETWEIVPHLADVLVTIPQLKNLQGERQAQSLRSVETDLVYSWNRLNELAEFLCTSNALDIIRIDVFYTSRHSRCCPRLPFESYLFRYPSAGLLQLMILAMRNYIATILYAPLRDAGLRIELLEKNCDEKSVEQRTREMCQTFAALEHAYIDAPYVLLPTFYAIVIVGFTAREELRRWLWHKFAHFEESGALYVNPVKKNLSILWNTPELVSQGFAFWKSRPLGNRRSVVDIDVIDLTVKVADVSLDGCQNDEMEALIPD